MAPAVDDALRDGVAWAASCTCCNVDSADLGTAELRSMATRTAFGTSFMQKR